MGYSEQPADLFFNNEAYKELKDRNSIYCDLLKKLYELCDERLKWVTQVFPNYTLHDIGHVVRVAGYMTNFLQIKVLSETHLFLVLCAGLMHDTGMVLFKDEYESYKKGEYLELDKTPEKALEKFQNTVREKHAERVKKVFTEPGFEDFFTYFKNSNVIDDLSNICRAHTEEIDWALETIPSSNSFQKDKYNPLQIAMLLRLGDNLDFDNRRAPAFMAESFSFSKESDAEWKKHVPVSNFEKVEVVDKEKHKYLITFSGKTDDNKVFRNTLMHIQWLEKEAEKISRHSRDFEDIYAFEIVDTVNEVTSNGYKSSKLAFELDYIKVLNLLMGEHIYNSKKDGLRELLQNAIDAVMVMKETYSKRAQQKYVPSVEIKLDKNSGEVQIRDNGIGMSKEVLKSYFFKIGESYYSSKAFLSKKGKYKPIAHFGIGFMSCFMLSDVVKLETKSVKGKDLIYEFDKGCKFTIEKTDLNEDTGIIDHGTWVTLEYNKVFEVFKSEQDLVDYVKELVLTDGFSLIIEKSDSECVDIKTVNNDLNGIHHIKDKESIFDIKCKYDNAEIPCPVTGIESFKELNGWSEVFFYDKNSNVAEDARYISASGIYDCLLEYEDYYELNAEMDKYKISEVVKYLNEQKQENNGECFSFLNQYLEDVLVNSEMIDSILLNLAAGNTDFEIIYYPFIEEQKKLEVFNDGKTKAEKNGSVLRDAELYFDFKFFAIIKRKVVGVEDADLALIANSILDGNDTKDVAFYNENEPYPFIKRNPDYIYVQHKNDWIVFEQNKSVCELVPDAKYYLNGIWVKEEKPVFPLIMLGTKLDYLSVNIKSREFELNVARTKFNDKSKELIGDKVLTLIYENMVKESGVVFEMGEDKALETAINHIHKFTVTV